MFDKCQMFSPSYKIEGRWYYDEKRILSIDYNITPILSCNYITSEIEKNI